MWIIAIVLGLVEGITEFLPISSTGHLILAGHLLGFVGEKSKIFEVVIQFGAILAVIFLYRDRFKALFIFDREKGFSGMNGLFFLFLTTVPASLVGLFLHTYIQTYLFDPIWVLWALGVGALAIIMVEVLPFKKRFFLLDDMNPKLALGIGLFQCLALWPGFSRSGATIMGGMILGADRKLAAEYSFIAAVPIMFAATTFELLKNIKLLSLNDFFILAVGFISSFIFAGISIKLFIKFLTKHTLIPFGIYRLGITTLFAILLFLGVVKF